MAVPSEPLHLTPEEVAGLTVQLSDLRHSVNNHLTLISAALELIRRKPEALDRMLASMADQPQQIRDELAAFSAEFERVVARNRP
jgi:hypothetical protein